MQNQIPSNWQEVKLRDVVNVYGGGTPSTQQKSYWGGDISWLTPAELTNYGSRSIAGTASYITESGLRNSSAKLMPENSIMLTSRATIGNVTINAVPMTTNQGFINIEPKKVDRDFFYYWLKSKRKYLNQIAIGSTFPELSKSVFKEIETTIPLDKEEQQKIASILSAFDDKIEVNNKIAKTLEQMAQNIFKEWFVTNKKDSWIEQNIGDVCKTYGGGTPSTKEIGYWKNGTIFWATPTDMTSLKGPFIFRTEKFITEIGLKKSSANLLPKGTILLTSRATVGILAISKVPISTNQGFICIVCKEPLSNFFMYCWLKRNVRLIQGLATGSTFPEISRGVFRKIKIVVPDNGTLDEFNGIVKPIFVQISKIIQENQKLTAMRDLLLPKLMRGEIRV